MVRLSNLADYAVVVMLRAARDPDCRISASLLAAETNLPAPTVAKIMNLLARAALLASHRGVGGGFRLARPAALITVADIVEAVDGPIALTHCLDHSEKDCSYEGHCGMRPHWRLINGAVRSALSAVSLDQLARPRAPAVIAEAQADTLGARS